MSLGNDERTMDLLLVEASGMGTLLDRLRKLDHRDQQAVLDALERNLERPEYGCVGCNAPLCASEVVPWGGAPHCGDCAEGLALAARDAEELPEAHPSLGVEARPRKHP